MAVSSRLAFLTILLCFFLAGAAFANSDYGDEIHAVKRSPDSDKGDQCTEENDDVDDDFDDTYKIIDNVAVSLSPSGRMLQQTANETETAAANETATATEKETTKEAETETEKEDVDPEDNPAAEEEVGNLYVLGH